MAIVIGSGELAHLLMCRGKIYQQVVPALKVVEVRFDVAHTDLVIPD